MKDTDLFSRIFGLAEPRFVEAVELDTVEGRVDTHGNPGRIISKSMFRGATNESLGIALINPGKPWQNRMVESVHG